MVGAELKLGNFNYKNSKRKNEFRVQEDRGRTHSPRNCQNHPLSLSKENGTPMHVNGGGMCYGADLHLGPAILEPLLSNWKNIFLPSLWFFLVNFLADIGTAEFPPSLKEKKQFIPSENGVHFSSASTHKWPIKSNQCPLQSNHCFSKHHVPILATSSADWRMGCPRCRLNGRPVWRMAFMSTCVLTHIWSAELAFTQNWSIVARIFFFKTEFVPELQLHQFWCHHIRC